MARFASWTNLSETTFLLDAHHRRGGLPAADLHAGRRAAVRRAPDHRVGARLAGGRGSAADRRASSCRSAARAWSGCGAASGWPSPARRSSAPARSSDEDRERIVRALRIDPSQVVDLEWIDNGPGWVGVLLETAERGAGDRARLVGRDGHGHRRRRAYPDGSECAVEVRAFCPGFGIDEDPVTGSLNAGSPSGWPATGCRRRTSPRRAPSWGVAGGCYVEREGDTVWVGGDARTTITGTVGLGE